MSLLPPMDSPAAGRAIRPQSVRRAHGAQHIVCVLEPSTHQCPSAHLYPCYAQHNQHHYERCSHGDLLSALLLLLHLH